MGVLLGAIADDFTGATDLCNTLVRRGMRTVQLIDVPRPGTEIPDAEALVVALKSRTIPAAEAIEKSLAALGWLQQAGARQILFKYCSTFDSTDAGNIGPVAEALMAALGTDFTLFCPAFPEAGRTIYKGYLFVGDVLLSESGMRDHPLTPMRDPSLVRVLQRQSKGQVGLVPWATVTRGAAAIGDAFASLRREGFAHAIVDAIEDHDLEAIGEAAADFKLITGGSGIALGLPDEFPPPRSARRRGCGRRPPPDRGAGGGVVGLMLDRDPGTSRLFQRTPAGVYDRPDRRSRGRRRGAGAGLGKAAARRRADPDLRDGAAREGRRSAELASAVSAPALSSRKRSPRSRAASSGTACGGWWLPAARPRGRWCRRWVSPACASAAKSIRACRGR